MKHFIRTILVAISILALCLMPSEELNRIDVLEITSIEIMGHIMMFMGFAFVFFLDWNKSAVSHSFWGRAVFVGTVSLSFGIITELLQYWLVSLNRSGSFADWIFDITGTAAGIALVYLKGRLHGPVI